MTEEKIKTQPLAAAGFEDSRHIGNFSTTNIATNQALTQEAFATPDEIKEAKIELIRAEICATVGPMIATLNVVLGMTGIPDDVSLIYALRTARAYWRATSSCAAELVELRGAPQ
jgi:hypothetical protein